ncbi:hypothetical protein [Bacteroides heparinolyticus]|uniref:hypothetical protein n=1 Tax=Prevotella heparinolytica TaxID=28113 RepID=UPI00359F90E7
MLPQREVEKYDFVSTENGKTAAIVEKDGRLIIKGKMWSDGALYNEYAPAKDFYKIQKKFYPNGIMRRKTILFGGVPIGIYEEYDEAGNLIKLVDEDKKFGKIKPRDIVEFLEKEGWFNRETGENKILKETPHKTDGSFYRDLMKSFFITFTPAVIEDGKEVAPPKWYIRVTPEMNYWMTRYVVNGNTGEFTKKEEYVIKYI